MKGSKGSSVSTQLPDWVIGDQPALNHLIFKLLQLTELMVQIRIYYIILLGLGISLLFGGSIGISVVQSSLKVGNKVLPTNSLNLTEPVYQATTGKFLGSNGPFHHAV